MAFIFISYFAAFFFVMKGNKKLAYSLFAISTVLSIAMFFYHTNSSLNLNF